MGFQRMKQNMREKGIGQFKDGINHVQIDRLDASNLSEH